MKDTIRLDKYLTEMGEGTRSQIKEMARKGRISVNGVTEKKSERKISPSSDTVAVDGRNVSYVEYEYYMLHKPQGVVSATEDRLHETVVELITENPAFASLDAVKNGRVFAINLNNVYCSGMRTLDGVLDFAQNLYPELYQ